jgi:hypothetical protein
MLVVTQISGDFTGQVISVLEPADPPRRGDAGSRPRWTFTSIQTDQAVAAYLPSMPWATDKARSQSRANPGS